MNTVNPDLYETPSFPFFHTGMHGTSKLNVSARTTSGRWYGTVASECKSRENTIFINTLSCVGRTWTFYDFLFVYLSSLSFRVFFFETIACFARGYIQRWTLMNRKINKKILNNISSTHSFVLKRNIINRSFFNIRDHMLR